ncbi:hypothetical protein EWM64_g3035 [Hericium alpestre]|uniref:Telomere replication protein EST3 n=1 Tax=Hericium alpestre TaxID=135208 RepID=A0A4Z0A408_9AGAM|nr:hypothetical protein EWM64_g3035 [Hericium alpestre]
MANTLKFPWIADYLIDVAQTYGGNFIGVPVHEKGKKVQLVKFLTYQTSSADDCIWAKVSDKFNQIPVCFTAKALQEYEMLNLEDSQGKRLTAQNGAVVSIKQFQPVFRRIPVGENIQKMTKLETLALDVGSVSIIGSAHEPMFGSPQDLQCNESLQTWMEGLREPGGGGNVLKLRKEQQSPAEVADSGSVEPGRANEVKTSEPAIDTFVTVSRKGKEKAKQDVTPGSDERKKFNWDPYTREREPMFLRKRKNKMILAQLDELSIQNSTSNAISMEGLRRPYSNGGSPISTPKRTRKNASAKQHWSGGEWTNDADRVAAITIHATCYERWSLITKLSLVSAPELTKQLSCRFC